ncbi:MAG TPA: hypothetical protein VF343_02085, partial [Syntrophales bacterium]
LCPPDAGFKAPAGLLPDFGLSLRMCPVVLFVPIVTEHEERIPGLAALDAALVLVGRFEIIAFLTADHGRR